MIKRLFLALLICLLPVVVWAQCVTPTGTTFTESFGDDDQLCWAGGSSVCTHKWEVVAGAAHSIIETPAGATDNTACAYSLNMDITDATAASIRSYGWFPRIPAGTTFDFYFSLRISAQTLDNYANRILLQATRDVGNAGPFDVRIYRANSTVQVYAYGSTGSTKITVSLEDWLDVHVHVEAGDAASYIDIDGTQQTFTANAYDFMSLWVGPGASQDAVTYQIGHIKIDSALAGTDQDFSAWFDFEDGSDEDTITTTILGNGTHCGNGVWNISGTASYIKIDEGGEASLPGTKTLCGSALTDATGSRGIRYSPAVGTDNAMARYTFYTLSNSVSVGYFWKHSIANEGGSAAFSVGGIQNAAGTDSAPVHLLPWNAECTSEGTPHPCCTGSHTGCDEYSSLYQWADESEVINIERNKWYWITIQFNAGGTHYLAVYDPATWQQVGDTMSTAADASTVAAVLRLGRNGADSQTDDGFWWYDDVLIDYEDGTFPLLPNDLEAATAKAAAMMMGF